MDSALLPFQPVVRSSLVSRLALDYRVSQDIVASYFSGSVDGIVTDVQRRAFRGSLVENGILSEVPVTLLHQLYREHAASLVDRVVFEDEILGGHFAVSHQLEALRVESSESVPLSVLSEELRVTEPNLYYTAHGLGLPLQGYLSGGQGSSFPVETAYALRRFYRFRGVAGSNADLSGIDTVKGKFLSGVVPSCILPYLSNRHILPVLEGDAVPVDVLLAHTAFAGASHVAECHSLLAGLGLLELPVGTARSVLSAVQGGQPLLVALLDAGIVGHDLPAASYLSRSQVASAVSRLVRGKVIPKSAVSHLWASHLSPVFVGEILLYEVSAVRSVFEAYACGIVPGIEGWASLTVLSDLVSDTAAGRQLVQSLKASAVALSPFLSVVSLDACPARLVERYREWVSTNPKLTLVDEALGSISSFLEV